MSKIKINVSALLLTGIILVAACNPGKRLAKKNVLLDSITVNSSSSVYRAATSIEWEIVNTMVSLDFDMPAKTAHGKAELYLRPYFYATDSLVLDAKSMEIKDVTIVEKGSKEKANYIYKDDKLVLHLNRLYKNTDTLTLAIEYIAMPYSAASGGSKAINDDKGLYFINTDNAIPGKPVQIWTQGETESNSHWVPTIDKPNQRTPLRLALTVPDSFVTLSNGELLIQTSEHGMRTDVWEMPYPIQVYAMMFAIGKFSITKDEWKGKEVSYYTEPAFAPYARDMFRNTPEMIDYFSKVTRVPYPWNKYSQVVVRDYVSGAMENTSASLFGDFMNQNKREVDDADNENVVSHELFHQWFGDYVTAESWSNLTLNESFATYGEQLWRRFKYGIASADELAMHDRWAYVYGKGATGNDPALVRFYYRDKEDMFDGISYQKGASILRYLNLLIGDAAFSKAMQLYLTKNALHPAEATQWRLAVEEVTGQDWNWFFNQWYYKGGHPILETKYNYNDDSKQLIVTINQTQKDNTFRLPLKIAVYFDDKTDSVFNYNIKRKTENLVINYRNGLKPVVLVDADYRVVCDLQPNMQPWQWLRVYKHSADNIVSKHYAVGAATKQIDDSSSQKIINLALQDASPSVKELVLNNTRQVKDKKLQDKWKADVEYIAMNEGNPKTRAAAISTLSTWKAQTDKEIFYNALNDSSYLVSGAALLAIKNINKDTAYILAKRLAANNPKSKLQSAIWEIVAAKGKAEDLGLFSTTAPLLANRQKIECASNLSEYIQHLSDNDAIDKAGSILYTMVKTEGIKSYRYAIGAYLFEAASYYKDKADNSKSNTELDEAKKIQEILKKYAQQVTDNETDEDNLKQYKAYMKSIYGD